jgi:hypothetical protein
MHDLISPELAAIELNLPLTTLAMDRHNGRLGIPFYKLGRRVRYSIKQIVSWLVEQQKNGARQS